MNGILPSGTTLSGGRYTIEKALGQGSFGVTYRATTQTKMSGELGELNATVNVAVKEFFMSEMNVRGENGTLVEGSEISMVQNYRRKFRKEAENLSHLKHPSIVKVLSIFDENNTTYYVMEYLEGESLDQRITRLGKLEESEALSTIRQVGSALQYMHEHQMLHLDMKPGNIMCCNKGRTVLIDFGLSKQYDENGEPESSTTLGLGTMGYAPIEQADYRQDGTFPATLDIYALGATLFKMLTGKRPLAASELMNEDDFLPKHLDEVGVSEATRAAVCKAMAFRRRDRFQSVADFMQALPTEQPAEEQKSNVENERTEVKHPAAPQSHAEEKTVVDTPQQAKAAPTVTAPAAPVQTTPSAPVSPTPSVVKEVTSLPDAKEDSHKTSKGKLIAIAGTCMAALLILFFVLRGCGGDKNDLPEALAFEVNGVPFNMVYMEGGTITIPELSEEFPAQEVTLDGFYVGETEVTPNLWAAVMGDEEINSHNIELFIDRLNEETGMSFCLPSMAQWWYAAQGDVLPRLVIDIPEDRSILEPFRTEGVKLIPSSGAATDGKEVEEAVTDDERPAEVEEEIVVADEGSEVVTTLSEAKQDVVVSESSVATPTTTTKVEVEEDDEVLTFVEVQPSFPGGDNALYSYLRNNIKKPQAARDNGITGTVYVSFVVERDGSLSNVSVMRDIGGGCGGEAVRVVKSMPRWNPGKNRGKAVRTRYNLPIQF